MTRWLSSVSIALIVLGTAACSSESGNAAAGKPSPASSAASNAAAGGLTASAKGSGASDTDLEAARRHQRRAQFLLDFIEAENSMGFHADQEAVRVLALSLDEIRRGQAALPGSKATPGALTGRSPAAQTGRGEGGPPGAPAGRP